MQGAMEGFYIKDSGIYARLFRPHGVGECPLVVLFHGIPGNETNLDIAYALRDEGCAVLTPSYNGCWGSKGDYRIETIPQNIKTVLDYVFEDEFVRKWGIDTDRIGVAGHSLGGWATLISPKISDRVRGFVALDPAVEMGRLRSEETMQEFVIPLRGVTAQQLMDGFGWAAKEWAPLETIEHLGNRYFMLVAATEGIPLEGALQVYNKAKGINPESELWILHSDHSFVSQRPLLRDLVVNFILENL
ncbi:MAG: alpha/beta hydrolase family protein [bacterium]|jgi:pimeloyl-ACP methyl ester carboxylesterase